MEKLVELRKSKGLLQKDVAEVLKISRTTYCSYEKGVNEPSISILNRLADYFDVSVDYLIGRVEDPALFDDARVPKSEIQELYDEMTPTQQRRMIDFALGILAAGDVSADKKRA